MDNKSLRDIQRQRETIKPDGYTIYLTGTEEFVRWFFETFNYYSEGKQFEDKYNFKFFPFLWSGGDCTFKHSGNKPVDLGECLSECYSGVTRQDLHRACRIILTRDLMRFLYKKSYVYELADSGLKCVETKLSFKLTYPFINDNCDLIIGLLHEIYMGFSVGAYNIANEIKYEEKLNLPN